MAKRARKSKKKSSGESPTCNCLLLCDDVLVGQARGKHFLQGVIGVIVVPRLPAMIGGYVAYVRISNVYDGQAITLEFVEAATDEALLEIGVKLPDKTDPLGVYNLIIPVPAFVVQRAGRYLFTASHGGTPITYTPVVIQAPEAESTEQT